MPHALARLTPHGGRIAVAALWVCAFAGWLAPRPDPLESRSDPALHRVFERIEGGGCVALIADAAGDVWWVTRDAVVRFAAGDPARREVMLDARRHRTLFGRDPEPFTAAHADARGDLWLGTRSGALLRLRDGVWQRVSPAAGGPRGAIRALASRGGALYVASLGLWRIAGDGVPEELEPFAGVPVDHLSTDAEHGIALAAGGRVWRADTGGWREAWRAREETVSALAFAPDGELWIGTRSGLVRVDRAGRAERELRDVALGALVPGDATASLAGGAGLFTRYAAGWRRVDAVGDRAVSGVSHLAPASFGAWWIAMDGRGLYRVRPGAPRGDAERELPGSWAEHGPASSQEGERGGTRDASGVEVIAARPSRI